MTIYHTCPPKPYSFVRSLKQSINFSAAVTTAVATTTAFGISRLWQEGLLYAIFITVFRSAISSIIPTLCEIEIDYILTTVNYMKDIIWDIQDFWSRNPTMDDQSVLYQWLCIYVQYLEPVYNYLVRMLNLADSLGLQDTALYDRAEIISIDFYNGLDFLKNQLLVLKDSLDL